eukprot:CAMPEP_0183490634 /NCGR_PEP_ID=MMETSP0370-20130417/182043_1 /TAXON_ID=268820 /ORGANISM="Peridinium aciculiferum, Strain PAER-2" /LENGTH=149 /DNA_ID=CAMNT_0025683971 /DNA_START=772 /DNA_END=1222 /DNA_ORIENTATION=+
MSPDFLQVEVALVPRRAARARPHAAIFRAAMERLSQAAVQGEGGIHTRLDGHRGMAWDVRLPRQPPDEDEEHAYDCNRNARPYTAPLPVFSSFNILLTQFSKVFRLQLAVDGCGAKPCMGGPSGACVGSDAEASGQKIATTNAPHLANA